MEIGILGGTGPAGRAPSWETSATKLSATSSSVLITRLPPKPFRRSC